jgi:4-amino-4-deoxy-L-arabinose transferase-like glycosyltransferase
MYGARVGIVAQALLAFSPFFQMTASNLMSHNTAVFYLLGCLALITVDWKRKSLAYGLAGICFGLLLNTRPLTAAALVPPFALLFASDVWLGKEQRMAVIRRSFAFAAGVLVMVGAFYLYNWGTTGTFGVGYKDNSSRDVIGWRNSVARGMQNRQTDPQACNRPQRLAAGRQVALVLCPSCSAAESMGRFLLVAAVCAIGVDRVRGWAL